MIIAEEFRCAISTPDAVKEGVLYCSTNATNAVDIWIAIGTFLAVAVSLALGILAYRSSQKAIQRQEERELEFAWTARSEIFLRSLRPVVEEFPTVNNSDLFEFTMEFERYQSFAKVHHEPLVNLISAVDVVVAKAIKEWRKNSPNCMVEKFPDWPYRQGALKQILWKFFHSVTAALTMWHADPRNRDVYEAKIDDALRIFDESIALTTNPEIKNWDRVNPLASIEFPN